MCLCHTLVGSWLHFIFKQTCISEHIKLLIMFAPIDCPSYSWPQIVVQTGFYLFVLDDDDEDLTPLHLYHSIIDWFDKKNSQSKKGRMDEEKRREMREGRREKREEDYWLGHLLPEDSLM
jgi:hypothetical protein